MQQETLPRKGEWFVWYSCNTHRVVWKIRVHRWEYDVAQFQEHAAKCRECIWCCLFPYHGGPVLMVFLKILGLAFVVK